MNESERAEWVRKTKAEIEYRREEGRRWKEALADFFIERLNEIAQADPEAMGKLIATRVPCNEALADHPTVQVRALKGEPPAVGVLGLLNGLVGIIEDGPRKGYGLITAIVENDGTCRGFRRTEENP